MASLADDIKSMLPEIIESARLIIKDSVLEECEKLQLVNETSDYIEKWVGWKTPANYAYQTLTEGNLPPGGVKEQFQVKTIYLKESFEIIGVMEIYNGYPTKDTLVVGWVFVLPEFQKMGYAKEAMTSITEEAIKVHFKKIRMGVHLKNWPALRFWYSIGFDKIVGIDGDEMHSEHTFASIFLEKDLI